MADLAGKVAIVTGAARGQGEAEARLFAAAGAMVVLTDVLEEEGRAVAADLGVVARFERHDVASEDDWARVVAITVESFGRLDALVNNAAIHWMRPLEEETLEGFTRMLSVNLLGTFLGIRAAAGPMRASGGGSIVNVSSTAALVGLPAHAAYGASKWGVRGLTKTAAVELGPFDIRVNSIHPGPIDTPMLPGGDAPGRFAFLPLGRAGQPAEVADLVLFLASDASAYLTGAEIAIDGGQVAGPSAAGANGA